MDDATLAEIEKRHQPMVLDGKSQCSWCYEYEHAWPCTIGLLLAEIGRLREELKISTHPASGFTTRTWGPFAYDEEPA